MNRRGFFSALTAIAAGAVGGPALAGKMLSPHPAALALDRARRLLHRSVAAPDMVWMNRADYDALRAEFPEWGMPEVEEEPAEYDPELWDLPTADPTTINNRDWSGT
jgi:hypothetical protein